MTTFKIKFLAKCTNFEVSNLGLELQVSSLGLEVFDDVSVSSRSFTRSRRLRSRPHHCNQVALFVLYSRYL